MYLTTIIIVLSPIILKCSGVNPINSKLPVRNSRSDKENAYQRSYYQNPGDYQSAIIHQLHHDPRYHRGFSFPGENFHKHYEEAEEERILKLKNYNSIPLDLIRKFNNFSEINDVLINLVEGQTQDEAPILEDRFSVGERSAAIVPKSAACMPELQTVKIAHNEDPSILYVPSCTRLERCGGCCSHSLLSCQPTDVESISFQVVKTQFVGGSKLKFMGKEVVLVDRHTKCKCDCKVQEKDCNKFQEYRKSECRCACTNIDEEKKCYKENITKLWNPEICACECRNILQCSTGYTFDAIRCRCMPVYIRRRYAEIPEHDPDKTDMLPVVPLLEGESLKDNL